MKLIVRLTSLISLFSFSSLSGADYIFEAKGAYFYPASSKFRQVYSTGEMYGLEASFKTWGQLYAWTSGSFVIRKGHSIGLNDTTRIAFYPIGAGLKYLFPAGFSDFYLGAGPMGAYMHIHDHSSLTPRTCRWGGGGILKGGVLINCTSHFVVDIFSDYSFLYVPVPDSNNMTSHTANLSGWSFGFGLGYRFGSSADCHKD